MLKELVTRSAWLTLGSALGRLLPLGVLVWASRNFESSDFASASAGFAWAGVAMSLTSTGEGTVMTQRLASQGGQLVRRGLFLCHAGRALLLSAALAALVLTLGASYLHKLFGHAVNSAVVAPAALAGVLWALVALSVAALNGCHAPRRASATLAVCGLLQGSAMATGLSISGTAAGMVWGLAAGCCAAAMAAVWQIHSTLGPLVHDMKVSVLAARGHVGRISFARNPVLWNTLASISVAPVLFLASSHIAKVPGGTRQLAQFFALEQIHQALVYVPAMLGQALLPMLSRQIAILSGRDARHALMQRMAKVTATATLAGIGAAWLIGLKSEWLVWLLKNPALSVTDVQAVQTMLLNASLALSLSLLGGALVGSGHVVIASLLNIAWGGLVFTLTALWVEQGNLGLRSARLLASVVLITLALPILWRYRHWAEAR